ncbi:hypothetical protein M3J09_006725 [Ascochyta lentis]
MHTLQMLRLHLTSVNMMAVDSGLDYCSCMCLSYRLGAKVGCHVQMNLYPEES